MKKYLLLLIPTAIYIVVDLVFFRKEKYPKEERIRNLEQAREAKKAKAVLKDFEQLNSTANGTDTE